jgi:hypothetical protein
MDEPAYRAVRTTQEAKMPNYMMLLYSPETPSAEQADHATEMPKWIALNDEWERAGSLVANGRLYPASSATTIRTRAGETELTDGPFAVTKEILAGYYILACADLDEALKQAERFPIARYGSVEVRPIMDDPTESPVGDRAASAAA